MFAVFSSAGAHAQSTWPNKPVRLIVPFTPGGTTDLLGREAAAAMVAAGIQCVVENRPGAGGIIGAEAVAKAVPDGYTLLVGTVSTHAIMPALNDKLGYDPVRDFAPITLLARVPNVLVVRADLPAKNVKELIEFARSKSGGINYASSGNGTSPHLSGELFKSMTGIQMAHIAYRGSVPALTDLIAGQVDLMFDNLPSSMPHIKSGKLRALAVTTAGITDALPGVPTVAESVPLPGFEASAWFGLLAPAGTPPEIIARVQSAVARAFGRPEIRDKLLALGALPVASSAADFAAHIGKEIDKWAPVVKQSGAKID
jgi:tripartite-type tricarboxylate transporter receptor subunit TctC